MADLYNVKYVRSSIGRVFSQKRTIKALGFTKLNQSRVLEMTSSNMGMVNKVKHLLKLTPFEKELETKPILNPEKSEEMEQIENA